MNPPRVWRVTAFGVLLAAATWIAASSVQRWERGLEEDRILYRALGYARAAARLTEAGRGGASPHLRAYGNAVGQGALDVQRLVVVDAGTEDELGVMRGARTVWSMHGHTGVVQDLDTSVSDRAGHLSVLFEGARAGDMLRLPTLVEIATSEPGRFRVAAYAPVVVDGEYRGLAAALVRAELPEASTPTAIWLLALLVLAVFGIATFLLPRHGLIVLGGVLVSLAMVLATWVPDQVDDRIRQSLVERADDMLAAQAFADSFEPVALVAPVPDREVWSADGALRLEREPSDIPPSEIVSGAERVGGPTASVHVHPDIDAELSGAADPGVLKWGLLAALLLGLAVGPLSRLLHNIRTDPSVYAYVSPAVLGLLVLVFLPFVTGVGLAFYRYHLEGNAYEFIGFGNFAEILAPDEAADMHFWYTLGVTLLWTTLNVFLHVAIGLALAMVLNRPKLRGKKLYRVLLILPWAIPNYITALLWRSMFIGKHGPVNRFLDTIGVGSVRWLDDSFWHNFIPNLVTNTWLGFPFMMVVALGALQSIPKELYEAAGLDGASAWQRFRHVTVPLLRPALLPAIILGTIWTFNMFNVIYLVSMGMGGTDILITEAYIAFHQHHRHGFAAAYAVGIFAILLAYTWITARVTQASEGALS